MKIFLLFIAISISIISCSTSNYLKRNDISNYSYMISGFNDTQNKFTNNGTGFILKEKNEYYLITNYHVLTNKDPETRNPMKTNRDTSTSIFVIFRPQNDSLDYYPVKFRLYESQQANFNFYYNYKGQILDIVVMKIKYPSDAKENWLTPQNLDTSIIAQENVKLLVVGFPNGTFKDKWRPTENVALSLLDTTNVAFNNSFLHFNQTTAFGMSGSPVYRELRNNKLKLISVNYMSDTTSTYIKGHSIYIKYALDLIKINNQLNKPIVKGDYYNLKKTSK